MADKIEDPQDELERIVRKCEELISCDNSKCAMKGDYWKCYMGNERRCKVYLTYMLHHNKA